MDPADGREVHLAFETGHEGRRRVEGGLSGGVGSGSRVMKPSVESLRSTPVTAPRVTWRARARAAGEAVSWPIRTM